MIQEAIILAGGLGTRLRSAVPDLPKCMAPVAGKPFIAHVIDNLRRQGVQRFIFSLGYLSEYIEQYLLERYNAMDYVTVVEDEPLGTGGGIALCMQEAQTKNVLIANGDTLFRINLPGLEAVHLRNGSTCTLALKPMEHFDRYGVVVLDEHDRVTGFEEKRYYEKGLINGGLYLLNRERFNSITFPKKWSFEKEFLEPYAGKAALSGSVQDGYFIDIGIPSDFNQAQHDLKEGMLQLSKTDPSWTLFLDRDGVINKEIKGAYVLNWEGFSFYDGVPAALATLKNRFGRIIIITNQRGVGRGLMSLNDLHSIHESMTAAIKTAGGRVDGIYYCTDTDSRCFHRKPNPGMALQAASDFPDLDLSKAIMVGNKLSDMHFGRSAGVYTVFIASTNPEVPFPHPDIDLRFNSLADFAAALES